MRVETLGLAPVAINLEGPVAAEQVPALPTFKDMYDIKVAPTQDGDAFAVTAQSILFNGLVERPDAHEPVNANPDALTDFVPAAVETQKSSPFMNKIRRMGRKVTASLAALSLAGGGEAIALGTAGAAAATEAVTTTVTHTVTSKESGSASDSQIATKKVNFLEDSTIKGKVKVNSKNCKSTHGGFWNSGKDANGKIKYFWDPKTAKLCRSKESPTGWVKMAGGQTGRKCKNPAKFNGKAPGPVLKNVRLVQDLDMTVKLNAHAKAEITRSCGKAFGEADATQKIRLRTYIKSLLSHGEVRLVGKLDDKVTAKARADVSCESTTTETTTTTVVSTPTPTPTPTVTPTPTPTKDGTQGPGEGPYATPCYDSRSTVDGDQNPATPADERYPATLMGTKADVAGYCVGKAVAPVL